MAMKKSIGRTLAHIDVAANTSVRIHEDFFNTHRDYHYLSQSEIAGGTRNDADVPIRAVCFWERSLHFPSPTRIERSAWGDRSEMLVELCGLGCFLRPQKLLHEKTNGRQDTW